MAYPIKWIVDKLWKERKEDHPLRVSLDLSLVWENSADGKPTRVVREIADQISSFLSIVPLAVFEDVPEGKKFNLPEPEEEKGEKEELLWERKVLSEEKEGVGIIEEEGTYTFGKNTASLKIQLKLKGEKDIDVLETDMVWWEEEGRDRFIDSIGNFPAALGANVEFPLYLTVKVDDADLETLVSEVQRKIHEIVGLSQD